MDEDQRDILDGVIEKLIEKKDEMDMEIESQDSRSLFGADSPLPKNRMSEKAVEELVSNSVVKQPSQLGNRFANSTPAGGILDLLTPAAPKKTLPKNVLSKLIGKKPTPFKGVTKKRKPSEADGK